MADLPEPRAGMRITQGGFHAWQAVPTTLSIETTKAFVHHDNLRTLTHLPSSLVIPRPSRCFAVVWWNHWLNALTRLWLTIRTKERWGPWRSPTNTYSIPSWHINNNSNSCQISPTDMLLSTKWLRKEASSPRAFKCITFISQRLIGSYRDVATMTLLRHTNTLRIFQLSLMRWHWSFIIWPWTQHSKPVGAHCTIRTSC